jgi:hypothetical protein
VKQVTKKEIQSLKGEQKQMDVPPSDQSAGFLEGMFGHDDGLQVDDWEEETAI